MPNINKYTLTIILALLAGTASAAVMTSGYSVGSGLLTPGGEMLFVDTAALGGNTDLRRSSPNEWDTYLIPGGGVWSMGDTVKITGVAIPIPYGGYTQNGTITFTVLQAAGGTGASGAGGLAPLGTATATLDISPGTSTYYVNFDSPVSFVADANSTSIGIHVGSSAPIWLKGQAGFEVTKYNRGDGTIAGEQGKLSVAGTVTFGEGPPVQIESFTAEASFAQRPDPVVLTWKAPTDFTSLVIQPDVGDVSSLTTDGIGSVEVNPLGSQTYTLTLNGEVTKDVTVIGLPEKEKLHIYLLIGQSNMQGEGRYYNGWMDGPHPRVVKFGSREGLEPVFAEGTHPLIRLSTSTSGDIGMGVEFGKTMIASQSDPEVMICLINHAFGNTAIDWWMPGVMHPTAKRSDGSRYYLYDEAVQRVRDAANYGVIKGVLWHQGEWNSSPNNDPDPNGYLDHLKDLVDNLRTDFNNPSLPFICGELVPELWPDGTTYDRTGSNKDLVEAIMADLSNHRNNTFCVVNDDLRGHSDEKVHFDANSQRLLGQRYAAAMITLQSDLYRLYIGVSGQKLQLSFQVRTDTEVTGYLMEFSTNLIDWARFPVLDVEGSPVDHGDGTATVMVQPEGDTPDGFFRLLVSP